MDNKELKEKETVNNQDEQKEEQLDEMTTSASSGAYEVPFRFNDESEKNESIKIKVSEIHSLIKATLINEEIYSEKPKGKGKDISEKNKKAGPAQPKTLKDAGKQSEEYVKGVEKKLETMQKNNTEDKMQEPKARKTTDDDKIEAYQGGMQDLEYEGISDKDKERFKDYFTAGDTEESKVGEELIDGAKKRKASKDSSQFRKAKSFGSDTEFIPNGDNTSPSKNIAFENTIKRYTFKKPFSSTKKALSKIPNKAKVNENIFELHDGNETIKVFWEGDSKIGVPTILEHKNKETVDKFYNLFEETINRGKSNEESTEDGKEVFNEMIDYFRKNG